MNSKTLKLFFVLGVILISLTPTVFGEEEEEEEPAWFPLLELFGAVIGIVATIITFKNYKGMKGGAVGEGFKFITVSLILLTVGVIVRGLNEQFGFMSEFMGELTFELFIYASIILIAIGSKKSYDMMK